MNFSSSFRCRGFIWIGISLLLGLFACGKDEVRLGNFRELPSPTTDRLTAVQFTSETEGYATGGEIWQHGFLLHTRDGGETWQTDTSVANLLENIHFDIFGNGYVCGTNGVLLIKSAAPDARWQPARQDWTWDRACFFLNPKLGLIVSGNGWHEGYIRRMTPLPWVRDTQIALPNELDAVWFSDSTTAHACGLGWMLRSDDAGRSWTRLPVPNDFYHSLHFPTPEIGYACGENGTLLKTTDAGRSWQTLRDGNDIFVPDCPMKSLWFTAADTGFIVGENGLFWRTENGGRDWQEVADAPDDADFSDVFCRGKMGWAVTRQGRVFRFEN